MKNTQLAGKKKMDRNNERDRNGKLDKRGKVDAEAIWKQVEDVVVPDLRLPVIDHVVCASGAAQPAGRQAATEVFDFLAGAKHKRLERPGAGCGAAAGGARRIARSKAGRVAEVRLPEEICGARTRAIRSCNMASGGAPKGARQADETDIEDVDFVKALKLRRAIHAREGGQCFYCRRRIKPRLECLDHVVPHAQLGCNSYRNVVSSCMECNARKGERPAEEFLRWLFREHRLSAAELRGRFRALELLAEGKLRPGLRK